MPNSKACFSSKDVQKRLGTMAKKMKDPQIVNMAVKCEPVSINGEILSNPNYITIFNSARVIPEGLPSCEPNYGSSGMKPQSPLQALADFLNGETIDPPQIAVQAKQPVALGKECMYCEGKRIDGETDCCSPVSDFTNLELPRQCRYPTAAGGRNTYFTAIPRLVVDDSILEGKDPGELCCSGRALFSLSNQWECRAQIGNEELLYQMKAEAASVQYKQLAFNRFMWNIYNEKVKPVEASSMFDFYDTSQMTSGEVTQKPLVMLLGPYSSGKTTFINHVLGESYPGANVGVEPTTDSFTVVQSGERKTVPGFALAADPNNNYQGVAGDLGIAFQRYFQAAQLKNPILNDLTFLDTPGVLAGQKQGTKARGYDYNKAVDWFAGRADVILLFFDVYRLDLSDEMGEIIRIVSREGRHRKVRIVLNKADLIPPKELIRAYGTIMWYMSQAIGKPDIPHVFMGNFGGFEYKHTELQDYFQNDQKALFDSVLTNVIPASSATAKVDRFIERIRRVRAHALLMDRLRTVAKKALPHQKKAVQRKIIADLPSNMKQVTKRKGINIGDFQPHAKLAEKFSTDDDLKMSGIPKLDKKAMANLEEALNRDLPRLVESIASTYGIEVSDLTRKAFGK